MNLKAQFDEPEIPPAPKVETDRLFVAILLDKYIQDGLTSLIKDLRSLDVPVKWLEPGNLHLTLCFLGEVPRSKEQEVMERLQLVRREFNPFGIQLGGLGGFPNLKKPSVLFAPVSEGWEKLRDLAGAISKNLRGFGQKQEDREFNAHVTLGRVKGFKGAKTIQPKLEGKIPALIGKMGVNSFALIKSQLNPEGPVYTILHEFNLAG